MKLSADVTSDRLRRKLLTKISHLSNFVQTGLLVLNAHYCGKNQFQMETSHVKVQSALLLNKLHCTKKKEKKRKHSKTATGFKRLNPLLTIVRKKTFV